MAAIQPEDLGTILSIWAHPDDETYLAGAVMAAAVANGQRVVCVTASAGERGTDDPDTWPPERLGAVRRWEAAAAMAALGVEEHHVLGLPDGELAEHEAEGREEVRRLVDAVRPDSILTFGPDGRTFHPDHVSVHEWVRAAWIERGCAERLLFAAVTDARLERIRPVEEELGVYMTDERPRGVAAGDVALEVRVAGRALDQKLAALRAMATQTAGVMAALDPDTFASMVAEETFVAAPLPSSLISQSEQGRALPA